MPVVAVQVAQSYFCAHVLLTTHCPVLCTHDTPCEHCGAHTPAPVCEFVTDQEQAAKLLVLPAVQEPQLVFAAQELIGVETGHW
jgi:hypothetical protein